MRTIDILLGRAERNRVKYNNSLNDIGNAAYSKMDWCNSVVCDFDTKECKYLLSIYSNVGKFRISADEFFNLYSNCRRVKKEDILKNCFIYA